MDLDAGRRLVQRWRTGGEAPVAPGPAPMSTVQRGIMVFERLCPGTAVFNLRLAARHTGDLDDDRLDAALAVLVRRHPSLRSTFADGDGGPVRVVRDDLVLTARRTDLRHLPPLRRAATALEDAARVAAEPFDLERGPLVRVHTYRLADDERLLVFVAHHLVCDGGSMRVLLGELDAAYGGGLGGVAADALPETAGPGALDHWRTHLAGLPELDLPADHARPAYPTFQADSVPLRVPAEVVTDAERFARGEGTTLFTVVLAAFQLLLGQHSGQTDFAVGTPEAGRSRPGAHGAVGLLSDMLVLRADLGGRPTFRELVRRARATCLAALAHRGVPFEDVVAALAPGRNVGGSLVRAGIAFQGDWGEPSLAGAPIEQVPIPRPGIRYDLDLHLWRDRDGLWGMWDYSTETFEQATAARMARRLPVLLARGLAEPDTPIDRLDLLTDEERERIAGWWRGPETEDPDVSLVELFEAQVARTPDAVAVEDHRRALTYRALDERANQLAHLLRGRSVEAGDVVGIRLGRSVDLAVAMLGIMKTGAAYLPLDPAYPADRTGYMLRDSAARLVVTDAELAELDGRPTSGEAFGPVAPERTAYVLYTSGSTGRPKGVLITHRNAAAMAIWGGRAFSPGELSRVLASTSVSFDVSMFEFYAPLCSGGTVVVVENALALLADPPDVTMVSSVPSAARALVTAGALPRGTRVVCLAGEAVTGTLADDLYATGHIEAVYNLYGPTEDTTYSTYTLLRPGEQPPPIGAPLPHGRGYVLGADLRPVPVGAVGELYLAGRGLSLGYVGQPGLTASRYVADPYAGTPGERMYRTGDMVRYRNDGALLYLGRRDFQVKVRGQRIELGEIESTLQRHPHVGDAVVSLTGGRLVGYLTARGAAAPDLDDIRSYLRRTLPVAMVPSTLMVLGALPRTPNGKVDRLSLPAADAPVATGGEPPRGAGEELVAEVWRQVLGLDAVGRDDDFFDLGGDSLKAGEVVVGLRDRSGHGFPLRLVFENSRLADLAAALAAPDPANGGQTVPRRSPDARPVLSFEQQRVWLECQIKSGVAYNLHGRQWLRGPLDVPALEGGIRAIIERHESLRTTFPVVRGLPEQRVTEPGPSWRLHVEDLSGLGDEAAGAAERLADDDAAQPFDLVRGPLLRCVLVRLSDTEHLLSMTVHHIVSDGRSIGLILRELSALYRAGGDPARAGLPPLPVQYPDYAVWQRAALTDEHLTESVEYWRDRLAGAPPALSLPTVRRRLPTQGTTGGKVRAVLGADEVAALHKLCRVHRVTPFMAMLAAFGAVLRRWSGQDDVVVGVPVDTRGAAGTGTLVGLFVNTVPLRVGLTGDPAFCDVLDRVRSVAVEGYVKHGTTPLEILVGKLRTVRDPSRTPLFQVLLNMIEDADGEWRLPGVEAHAPELPAQPSKFDLNLDVHHSGDDYRFELLYHADRFEEPLMRALLGQVAALLAAAADDPSRGVLEYELEPENVTSGTWPAGDPATGLTGDDVLAVPGGDTGLTRCAMSLALPAGAVVTSAGEATAGDPAALPGWLRDAGATAVYLTAPLLRTLVPYAAGTALPLLRHVFLDNRGDLTAHDVASARRLAPGCRVVALYRTAGGGEPLAAYEVPADWSPATAPLRVPIGTEPGGGPADVRNTAGLRAAIGEVGELYAGGAGTGDLVRRRPGGLVEFAGPAADPLETVAVLRDAPGVRDAVVTPYRDPDGRPGLVAYVACRATMVDLGRLRQRLVTHLPEYLIPRHMVTLDRLPLTASGEYDLNALPDPADDDADRPLPTRR